MDPRELRERLESLAGSLSTEERSLLTTRLQGLISVFPFNEFEYALMFLLDRQAITFEEYERLRASYVSTNRYLDLYGLAPRIFGEIWVQQHLRDLDTRFQKPTRTLDPSYQGQYDLWIEGIRVEVKAARAIATRRRGSLLGKALRYGAPDAFWMNFQQIKLGIVDVFVFVGVWVDRIAYWVLSDREVATNRYLSHQHRGGIEYQIGITDRNLAEFDAYAVEPRELGAVVIRKGHGA